MLEGIVGRASFRLHGTIQKSLESLSFRIHEVDENSAESLFEDKVIQQCKSTNLTEKYSLPLSQNPHVFSQFPFMYA